MNYIFERGNFTENELEVAIIELFKNEDYDYQNGEYMQYFLRVNYALF